MNEFSLKCLLFCMCICNVTVKAWVGLCLMWCPFHFKSVFALLWTKLLEENRQNLHYIFRKWRKLHTWRKPHIPENGFLFVQGQDPSFAWRIKSVFAEFPGLVMRHEAIEMVCAHVAKTKHPLHIIVMVWIVRGRSQTTLLYEMPSNPKGKNFVSKIYCCCPQNTMEIICRS